MDQAYFYSPGIHNAWAFALYVHFVAHKVLHFAPCQHVKLVSADE